MNKSKRTFQNVLSFFQYKRRSIAFSLCLRIILENWTGHNVCTMSAVFDKTYTNEPAMQRTALLNYDSDRRRNIELSLSMCGQSVALNT